MRKYILLGLAVLLAPSLAAQQRDTARAQGDTAEAGRLRREIEQRFSNRVQQQLNLTPDQTTKLRATQERFGTRRRSLMQQQMERRHAIEGQMQPGVPANSDSLRKLMDGVQTGRAEMVKVDQEENREMAGYLTPVQQARFQQMREQFIRRVGELRMERREGRGFGRGQGMVPRRPAIRGGARRRGI
jgi:Spy/CpxP family protein refolding chaperone